VSTFRKEQTAEAVHAREGRREIRKEEKKGRIYSRCPRQAGT
jgi:hypothetical protein